MTAFVTLDGVRKRWSDAVAIGPLSLEIPRGEILALLGPSGSGKTTVLRLLGGFETCDAGRMVIGEEDVTAVPPARRRCGMVFQHYALFPHLDVGENVAFGLKGNVTAKVAEALALVGLDGFERRRVQELSGGQQQRVALARALAPEPRLLLLDEPLSNLDPSLRERTRRELRALIKRVGITSIFVTHEQEEAFDLGDRVAVLQAGRLEQLAPADELYDHPASLFVATFVGRANVLRGPTARALGARNGEVLVVRPERLRFADAGVPGVVRERRYTGAAAFYQVDTEPGERVEVLAPPDAARVGERVYLEALGVIAFPEGLA
jgi:putative spermidine/putrescine transport system ATP-binding protein